MKCQGAAMNMMKRARAVRDGEQGSSLIEFALVLPVMLMVMMGIATFGIALNNYTSLTNATSVAARQVALSRGQTTDPCSLASTSVYNAAPLLTKSDYTFALSLNGTKYSGTSCSSASTTSGAAGNMTEGSSAILTVTYPCSLVVYGKNYAPSCTLTTQTAELVQ
jgi:Flp pilus assembly protein TadG